MPRRRKKPARPQLRVGVQLGTLVTSNSFNENGFVPRLLSSLSDEINRLCVAIGSRAMPIIEIIPGTACVPISITLENTAMRCAQAVLIEAAHYVEPDLFSMVDNPQWPEPEDIFLNALLPSQIKRGGTKDTVVEVLTSVASDAIRNAPERLFPEISAMPFSDGFTDSSWAQRSFEIVRQVAHLGTSLRDAHRVELALLEATEAGLEDDEIVERLVAGFQEHVIRVHVGPKSVFREDSNIAEWHRRDQDFLMQALFGEHGIRLPAVEFVRSDDLKDYGFAVQTGCFRGLARIGLTPQEVLVNEPHERLQQKGLSCRPRLNPATMRLASLVNKECYTWDKVNDECSWSEGDFITMVLASEVRKQSWRLINRDGMDFELALLQSTHPNLVSEVLANLPAPLIAQVFRMLLSERVSIADMPSILDAMLLHHRSLPEVGSKGVPRSYAESVRQDLCRHASAIAEATFPVLFVYLLHPAIEERLQRTLDGSPLTESELQAFYGAIRDHANSRQHRVSILTHSDIRLCVRELIAQDFPDIDVLSYHEIALEVVLQPLDRITW